MGSLQRMQKILSKPETMVLLAWSITITVFVLAVYVLGAVGREIIRVYIVSLVVISASIATALALGLKNFSLALLLALPGGFFMFFALMAVTFSIHKFVDVRPVGASMLFFLFMATCGPLLIRSFKDEETRRKIYRGALLLMVPLALLAATAFFCYFL